MVSIFPSFVYLALSETHHIDTFCLSLPIVHSPWIRFSSVPVDANSYALKTFSAQDSCCWLWHMKHSRIRVTFSYQWRAIFTLVGLCCWISQMNQRRLELKLVYYMSAKLTVNHQFFLCALPLQNNICILREIYVRPIWENNYGVSACCVIIIILELDIIYDLNHRVLNQGWTKHILPKTRDFQTVRILRISMSTFYKVSS